MITRDHMLVRATRVGVFKVSNSFKCTFDRNFEKRISLLKASNKGYSVSVISTVVHLVFQGFDF